MIAIPQVVENLASVQDIPVNRLVIDEKELLYTESTFCPGTFELLGDIVLDWPINNLYTFLQVAIKEQKSFLLNSIDGFFSCSHEGYQPKVSNTLCLTGSWSEWLAARNGKHRKLIRKYSSWLEAQKLRIEGASYADSKSFGELLASQVEHLASSVWSNLSTFAQQNYYTRWPKIIRTIASTEEAKPQFLVLSLQGVDRAVVLTAQTDNRRFFVICLGGKSVSGWGSALLTETVKLAIADPTTSYLTLGYGEQLYKKFLEPSQVLVNYQLAFFTQYPDDALICRLGGFPEPPFIVNDMLYTLQSRQLLGRS